MANVLALCQERKGSGKDAPTKGFSIGMIDSKQGILKDSEGNTMFANSPSNKDDKNAHNAQYRDVLTRAFMELIPLQESDMTSAFRLNLKEVRPVFYRGGERVEFDLDKMMESSTFQGTGPATGVTHTLEGDGVEIPLPGPYDNGVPGEQWQGINSIQGLYQQLAEGQLTIGGFEVAKDMEAKDLNLQFSKIARVFGNVFKQDIGTVDKENGLWKQNPAGMFIESPASAQETRQPGEIVAGIAVSVEQINNMSEEQLSAYVDQNLKQEAERIKFKEMSAEQQKQFIIDSKKRGEIQQIPPIDS